MNSSKINYLPLTPEDLIVLEDTMYERVAQFKRRMLFATVFCCIGFAHTLVTTDSHKTIDTVLVTILALLAGIAGLSWYTWIYKINKDMREQQKVTFTTKVTDKKGRSSSSRNFNKEYSIILSDNDFYVSYLDLEEEVYNQIPLFATISIIVTRRSRTFLSCDIEP
ncbi:hypothetical protein F0L74_15040 [Chitinophaga agrisoli]|uniref:Uncharacterized protein n=1 Tax=Chitinophaga agrisoli TaxID=2607653 RepID=A0A5B2VZ59_9BACT|nr:hypothetical protein [Chitinophaga agrisoli]KAA2243790.1 hypothetical protein F0L74_15040 [Chitinophaga agrisoli]